MKKTYLLILSLTSLISSCSLLGIDTDKNRIYLDPNGVTVKCEKCKVGFKGVLNNVEYEVVNNELLRKRIDEQSDLSKLCLSLVTDLSTEIDEGLFGRNLNPDIQSWDVSNVRTMKWLFINSSFNKDISYWDVGNVESMEGMFQNSTFNQDISGWNVGNVKQMSWMFSGSAFNKPIGNWNVGRVTNMSWMFQNSSYNQSLANWDVRSVSDMTFMFYESVFNQNLTTWCVSNIKSEPQSFSTYSPLSPENKPKWGTCAN